MPAAEVFEEEFFASLYDCLNPWSASDDFYVDRAVEAGDPVLDLGCGTGMLASGIASKGLSVTAADPAEAMLRVARSRPGGAKVHWIQSDGQGLRLPHRFRFIYMTGHAFQQLLTDDDAVALLRAAAAHLAPEDGLSSKLGILPPGRGDPGPPSCPDGQSARPGMAGSRSSWTRGSSPPMAL